MTAKSYPQTCTCALLYVHACDTHRLNFKKSHRNLEMSLFPSQLGEGEAWE